MSEVREKKKKTQIENETENPTSVGERKRHTLVRAKKNNNKQTEMNNNNHIITRCLQFDDNGKCMHYFAT